MNIPEEIFKSYDIRGIYPKDLNEQSVIPITKAIFKLLQEQLKYDKPLTISVGRDMRLSTPVLFQAVSQTLTNLGAKVIDLGIVSTPTFYFAVFKYKFDGGIQITASHNPKSYNGLKIVRYSVDGLVKIGKDSGMDQIKLWSINGVDLPEPGNGTIEKKQNILQDETNYLFNVFKTSPIKKFKIVLDPANALGALYLEEVFKQIPADLIKMNFELDGNFPAHEANPLDFKTLEDLQKKVVEQKADLGIATDGDGDRLFFIDEEGQVVSPSIITAIVAKELLKKYKGEKIIADIRYILTPKKIVEESEGIFVSTRVGHAFISQKMKEIQAIFAGESSGHYYFKETGNAESQIPMIILVLKVLTENNKAFSSLVEDYKKSHESGEINFQAKNSQQILDILKEEYKEGEIDTQDGIAINFPNFRFSVRTSNTEPILRLNIEGESGELVEQKRQEIVNLIEKHAAN